MNATANVLSRQQLTDALGQRLLLASLECAFNAKQNNRRKRAIFAQIEQTLEIHASMQIDSNHFRFSNSSDFEIYVSLPSEALTSKSVFHSQVKPYSDVLNWVWKILLSPKTRRGINLPFSKAILTCVHCWYWGYCRANGRCGANSMLLPGSC